MPIHSKTSLYPGVNAHLNSFLQAPGNGWESFHVRHIEDIATVLEAQLPPNYYVLSEKSLQISYSGFNLQPPRTVRPNVSFFRREPFATPYVALSVTPPTAVLPLAETLLDDDETLMSLVIYDLALTGSLPGKPITRIEVLSPSNKPPLGDYRHYRQRRQNTLASGVSMIEIDYLHLSPPIITRLPSYPDGDEGAFPYTIAVSTPYPSSNQGEFVVYGVGVDEPLPHVSVPLGASESVSLDFNQVYANTFEARRAFSFVVDYATDPIDFDRYHPNDQARIRALLERIRREHGEGA
jgi:hypothetical protein